MKCNHKYRSGPLFEGHKIGGAYLGKCENDALEDFVVCFDHVNKEALWVMIQQHQNRKKRNHNVQKY